MLEYAAKSASLNISWNLFQTTRDGSEEERNTQRGKLKLNKATAATIFISIIYVHFSSPSSQPFAHSVHFRTQHGSISLSFFLTLRIPVDTGGLMKCFIKTSKG